MTAHPGKSLSNAILWLILAGAAIFVVLWFFVGIRPQVGEVETEPEPAEEFEKPEPVRKMKYDFDLPQKKQEPVEEDPENLLL